MTLVDPFNFQVGLVTALRAKTTLTTLLASLRPTSTDTGIFDAVPENAAFPYIVVGEGTETDASTFGADGLELLTDVEIWTSSGETSSATTGAIGYKQAQSIKEIVRDLLKNDTITASGCTVTVLSVDTPIIDRDDTLDPATRNIVLQARVLLEAD